MKKTLKLGIMMILVVASAAGGYLCGAWKTAQPVASLNVESVEDDAAADPFERFRTERQQLRQMQTAQLNELIYGGKADEQIVRLAQEKLLSIMDCAEKETSLEGLLTLRGFEDAIASVDSDAATIVVRAQSVTQQQTAVIVDAVMRETGLSGGNIKIIPIN